jgi:hypothetical protein
MIITMSDDATVNVVVTFSAAVNRLYYGPAVGASDFTVLPNVTYVQDQAR